MCFFIIFRCVDVVSKADIKKQFRDVIFVEDDDGNLVKYIRAKENEKSQRGVKPPPPVTHSAKTSKKPKCKAKSTPPPAANRAKTSKKSSKANPTSSKANPKSSPLQQAAVAVAAPLKSFQMEAEKMIKCSVILVPLTEDDIEKEKGKSQARMHNKKNNGKVGTIVNAQNV